MEYKDYYKIMGLQPNASTNDIKRAYRKLASQYHPDVSKAADAEEKFKEVSEAYKVLKNPQKRAAYDKLEDKLEADWQIHREFKTPPKVNQEFDPPLIVKVLGIILIIILFSTILQPISELITVLFLIYLIFRDR